MSKQMTDAQALWADVLFQLRLQMDSGVYNTWFSRSTGLDLSDNLLTIGVASAQAVHSITNRLQHVVDDAARRVYGRPLRTTFTVVRPSKPNPAPQARPQPKRDPAPSLEPKPVAPVDSAEQAAARLTQAPATAPSVVELVDFDPAERGWVKVPIYAIRFWQPYLTPTPYHLWEALRSFAFDARRLAWPSVETLADICADGNRHRILGRAAYKGCKSRTIGALEILVKHHIVRVVSRGEGRSTAYAYRVLITLPLLTPTQVGTLSNRLQLAHERFIRQANLDLVAWGQLTAPSLIPPDALNQMGPQGAHPERGRKAHPKHKRSALHARPDRVEENTAEGLIVRAAEGLIVPVTSFPTGLS